LHEAKAVLRG